MIDQARQAFRPGRVRASWAILVAAALLKAACLCWLGWVAWYAVQVSQALAGMAHQPTLRHWRGGFVDVFAPSLQLSVLAGVTSAAVAALQRLALGRGPWRPLHGWIVGSGAAAALATAGWMLAVVGWNRLGEPPDLYVGLVQLAAGSLIEAGAIAVLQRRLLAQANGGPARAAA